MNPLQPNFGKIKKALRFIWRHVFTLGDLSLSIKVLIFHTLIWKNALISLAIAITIDWAKQFIKLGQNFETPSCKSDLFNIAIPLHKRQWWNPELYGSATNILNTHNRIKYD